MPLLKREGGFALRFEPEDLPDQATIIQCFRVKGGNVIAEEPLYFYHAVVGVFTNNSYTEAVTQKLFKK